MSTLPVNANTTAAAKTQPAGATTHAAAPAAATSAQAVTSAGNLSSVSPTPNDGASLLPLPTSKNLPVLDPPKEVNFDDASISSLIALLSNESNQLLITSTNQRIDDQARRIKDQNEIQAGKLKEQQNALQESKNRSWWAKLWGYVSKVLTAVAAVAIAVGTGGAGSGLAMYMAYTAVAGLIKSAIKDAGGGEFKWLPSSIGDLVTTVAVKLGADEKIAGYVGAGLDIAVALASVAAVAKIAQAGAKAGTKLIGDGATQVSRSTSTTLLSTGTTMASAVGQIAQGWTGIQAADAMAVVQTSEADIKGVKAALEFSQSLLSQESEFAQTLQSNMQALQRFVFELVGSDSQKTRSINQNMA